MANFDFIIKEEKVVPNGSRFFFDCVYQGGSEYSGWVWMGNDRSMLASAFRKKDFRQVSRMTPFGQKIEAAAIQFVKEI